MKLKLALLATLAAAAMPIFASAQAAAPARAPMTDSQLGAAAHRELRDSHFDAARKAPLAYGYINMDGSKASGTNFTSSFNSSSFWYTITIPNVHYFFSSFSTVTNPSLPRTTFCSNDSSGGSLLVLCFDTSGNPVQAEFSFITF